MRRGTIYSDICRENSHVEVPYPPLPLDFGVLIFLGTLPPARPRDAYRRGVADQAGGHNKGCTLLAPTMQAGQEGVDKELRTRRAAVVGLVNQHRTKRLACDTFDDSDPSTRGLYATPSQLLFIKDSGGDIYVYCTYVRFSSILLQRNLLVVVGIQQFKYKAIARHYVEFTLGDGAIAVYVKDREACVPFLPRDFAITIFVKQLEGHAANVVELHFGDEVVFVQIDHVKAT